MLDLDPKSVQYGLRVYSHLVKALSGPLGDDMLPRLVPYISAVLSKCDEEKLAKAKAALLPMMTWYNYKWFLEGRGPPPFIVEDIVAAMVACGPVIPIIDELLREELQPPAIETQDVEAPIGEDEEPEDARPF